MQRLDMIDTLRLFEIHSDIEFIPPDHMSGRQWTAERDRQNAEVVHISFLASESRFDDHLELGLGIEGNVSARGYDLHLLRDMAVAALGELGYPSKPSANAYGRANCVETYGDVASMIVELPTHKAMAKSSPSYTQPVLF